MKELPIRALSGQQFLVRSLLCNAAFLDQQDAVRLRNGRQAMGDENAGGPFFDPDEVAQDRFLGLRIERSGRFVQEQELGLSQEGASQGHPLLQSPR